MTTIDTRPEASAIPATDDATGSAAGRSLAGAGSWITTADHKRIGRLFVGFSLLFAIAVVVVGAVFSLERVQPSGLFLEADSVEQVYSFFRVGLSFMVVAPLLLGLSVAVVPLQVGARSLALPRVAALGFWSWLAGSIIVVVAYLSNGGPSGGEENMVDLFLMGLALTCIGLVAAAGSVVVSALTTRAPGMTLARVPVFTWSALVGGVGLVVTLPVLVGVLILQTVDHRYGRAAFGGNTGILEWTGWAMTQPTTYVLVIPMLGIAADVVVTASRRRQPQRGTVLVGIVVFATAMVGAVTQRAHDVPWGGADFFDDLGDKIGDLLPYALFNLVPILGVLIVLGLITLSLKGGRPRVGAAFVFSFLGMLMLLTGVLAQVLTPLLDLQLSDTVYEEGVFLYIVYGAVLAALGAVAFWGPKLWGRRIGDKAAVPLALLGFLATILAALPMLVAGFQGQPAGAAGDYDYEVSPELLNGLAFAGHALMALTVVAFVLLALRAFTKGDAAGDDPWGGQTLEWMTTSPPPADNFTDVHTVASATPLIDLDLSRGDN